MDKIIKIPITAERWAQITAMCEVLSTTPEQYFSEEMQGAFHRMTRRYQSVLAQQQPVSPTVTIVDVDPE